LTLRTVFEFNCGLMYPQTAALELDCWRSIKLLLKTIALSAAVTAILCGCAKASRPFQDLSQDEQLNILRAQADSAMLVRATNGVPNIHAVLEENADTYSGSVQQWRGWVRLDYLDQSGGIQQTNIPMTFAATFDGRLFGTAPAGSGSALIDIQ
jgi:hypothetical protein